MADLEPVHRLNRGHGRVAVVKTDETKAARAASVVLDHDTRRDDRAKRGEERVEPDVRKAIGQVKDEQVAAVPFDTLDSLIQELPWHMCTSFNTMATAKATSPYGTATFATEMTDKQM